MSVKGNISVKQSNITVDLDLLNSKVDKITGKGLSKNDYTTEDRQKLSGIEPGANKYTHPGTHSTDIIITPDEKTATEKFVLLDNVIGSGRTTETIKVNADNIVTLNNNLDNLAGQDRTIETVKANADEIIALKEDYATQRQQDQLKVATVEKGLNDYKSTMASVNVNQEAKQKATGYGTISLPPNAANGQVSVGVKGRTLKNELNYNRDTWVEWENVRGITVENKMLTLTGGNAYTQLGNVALKPSTKYGIVGNVVINTYDQGIRASAQITGNIETIVPVGVIGNFKKVLTSNNSPSRVLDLNVSSVSVGKIQIAWVQLFELPTGSEIETDFSTMTADQLAIKYPYIKGDSAKSTSTNCRLKSVGKNFILPSSENRTFSAVTIVQKIKVKPKTNYTITFYNLSVSTGSEAQLKKSDMSTNLVNIYNKSDETVNVTFNTGDESIVYLRGYKSTGNCIWGKVQLEEGTYTPYEPYTESNMYLSNVGELRSLPNGTKDEIRVSGGKAENIQRNNKKILQASDIVRSNNANVNFDIVRITKPLDYIGYNKWHGANRDVVLGGQYSNNKEWNGIDDSASFIGSLYVGTNLTEIWYAVAKGTYADLASAKTALAGLELTYQLAEPIVTPIQVSGNIVSNPSGTIYIDPVTTVAGIYTANGIDVTHEDLPIRAIEKISKVDFTTGIETELDVSKATIAENKLSFTHEDLSLNDIVFFEYEYDVETTQAETTVEYYDSRYTIKDSETDKLYKWNVTVANGTPSISVVEV